MCGRFTLTAQLDDIGKLVEGLRGTIQFGPRYNIAPTQQILTLLNDNRHELTYTRWGLIPSWAKDPTIGNRLINARAETLHQKPSFKTSLRKLRCLIFADGFYEWQSRKNGPKIPWYVHLKSRNPFAFAGLWSRWIDKTTKEEIITSTIITTNANTAVEPIHNRMPVILKPEAYAIWLSPDEQPPERLLPLLTPYPGDEMAAYQISTLVNNPANDSEACIIAAEGER